MLVQNNYKTFKVGMLVILGGVGAASILYISMFNHIRDQCQAYAGFYFDDYYDSKSETYTFTAIPTGKLERYYTCMDVNGFDDRPREQSGFDKMFNAKMPE